MKTRAPTHHPDIAYGQVVLTLSALEMKDVTVSYI